jgi:glycosyltransferase involved in cell wall biosynthesis
MLITHVITTLDLGGAEKQLLTLAAKQVEMGNSVCVFPLKGNLELAKDFSTAGIKIDTSIHLRNPIIQIIMIRRLLRKEEQLVLHAHLPRAELVSFLAAPRNVIFGLTRHNAELFLPSGPKFLSNLLSRLVLSKSKFQIAISNTVADFIRAAGDARKCERFELIYYAAKRIDNYKCSVRKSDNLSLVCVARLAKQKNHQLLFNALSKLPESECFHLTLIGRGSEEEDLLTLARELDIAPLLTWKKSIKDIRVEIAKHDILVLPSKYEGFGLILLEAMEIGLPIIASNCGAVVEVLGPDYSGLFDSQDEDSLREILSLFKDYKVRKRAQHHLYDRFDRFNVDILYGLTDQTYRCALENR